MPRMRRPSSQGDRRTSDLLGLAGRGVWGWVVGSSGGRRVGRASPPSAASGFVARRATPSTRSCGTSWTSSVGPVTSPRRSWPLRSGSVSRASRGSSTAHPPLLQSDAGLILGLTHSTEPHSSREFHRPFEPDAPTRRHPNRRTSPPTRPRPEPRLSTHRKTKKPLNRGFRGFRCLDTSQTCRRGDLNDRSLCGRQRRGAATTGIHQHFRKALPRALPLVTAPCRGLPLAIR